MADDLSDIFSPGNMVAPTNGNFTIPANDDAAQKAAADKAAADKVAAEEAAKNNAGAENTVTTTIEIPEPVKAYFKEKFGTENVEEVETGYKSLATLRQEREALQTRTTELETQNKQLSEKPTYKSDFAKKADEIYELTKGKVSAETIARFYDLDPDKLTGEAALDLLSTIENPDSTAEDRKLIRDERFSTADELGLTDGQKAIRRDEQQKAVANARQKLSQFKAEAFKPIGDNQPDPQLIQAETDRRVFWETNTDKIDASVFKVEMPMKSKVPNNKGGIDEIDSNFIFELPTETKQKVLQGVAQQLNNPANGKFFTPDANGIKNANDYVRQQVRDAMWGETMKAMVAHSNKREAAIHEKYAALYNNTDFLSQKVADKSGQAGVVDYNANAEKYLASHS